MSATTGLGAPRLLEIGEREEIGAKGKSGTTHVSWEITEGHLTELGGSDVFDRVPGGGGELALFEADMAPGRECHSPGDRVGGTRGPEPAGHSFDDDGGIDSGHAANQPWLRSSENWGSVVTAFHTLQPWRRQI